MTGRWRRSAHCLMRTHLTETTFERAGKFPSQRIRPAHLFDYFCPREVREGFECGADHAAAKVAAFINSSGECRTRLFTLRHNTFRGSAAAGREGRVYPGRNRRNSTESQRK